ncbi:GNAT family N-acetyltransferase, partial [Klebsiella pneumoniae]|nr:GNAT family N-acetyltransferase [Klebsiella pneumoniae]
IGPAPLLPIITERLLLRPYTHDDLDASLAYYGDPQVARHLLEPPWTPAVARERIAERVERTGLDGPRRALALVVEHEGRVVGDVAVWA